MATVHKEEHGHGDEHHGHSPYLHHHFETPVQQFESDKLGMWLFLATEILLFGGLFCAYSVYRHNHPDVFIYAHQFLNKKMGATNTIVLIFSSFTMAWSVRAIQQGKKWLCAALLVITLLCACTFMVIKYFEYSAKIQHGLLWGSRYKPHHEGESAEGGHESAVPPGAAMTEGSGEKHTVVAVDETPATGVSEEPAGAAVDEHSVSEATASAAKETAAGHGGVSGTTAPPASGSNGSTTVGPPGVAASPVPADYAYPGGIKLEPSKIKPAALAPAGLTETGLAPAEHEPEPKNVQTFFAIYFAMTGLHGIHVLIGMIVISIMLVYVIRGKYNADYWTPVDLTGLYWHIVDLIWIFLFPLLYLIAK